ncbi:hypothetical protein MYX78_10040 [Acidobacteria bacterium AH-259-G07]|nr:hypothetical protein [Acidobacteria bacterium AH-259-G07]
MMCSQWDPLYFQEQYEALRGEALDAHRARERGHGLALFLARGMAAWLVALSALSPRTQSLSRELERGTSNRHPDLPQAVRSNLTLVLAGMVLACSEELKL